MKRYLVVLGTRPEAIKMCPLILALRQKAGAAVRLLLTGQHRDMVTPVLDFFGVQADACLDVMRQGQSVGELTERLLRGLPEEMAGDRRPDLVLVHGDTTSAFVGALCAFYAGVPVAHIEAGLRTGDVHAPFPEEFNRRAIDAMSDLYFAPTGAAAARLIAEGSPKERIFAVGNTATDALRLCLEHPPSLPLLNTTGRRLLVITAHRREMSCKERYELLTAIRHEIEAREDVLAVFPVHPSPAVGQVAKAVFEGCANVRLTPSLSLPDMQHLLARAYLLLTDSGGMQEEATYLGLPTLVLRDVTERPEGVRAGVLRIVGTKGETVRAVLGELLDHPDVREGMAKPSWVYGDGYVSERIADILAQWGTRP
ncbi:MAG: UDP-N-acetylglucosamine 2-epimerase (non-hydrolyzing) [Ruminococcaceae bacterium]|nr:UDP-N-acetylglucosamine 2-epimerase (non-hydrolyzing) [Oscillospiraceae bacterium]